MGLFTLNNLFLLLTGLVCIYLLWRFYSRWKISHKLYDLYYAMGVLVLLVSGLLLIFLGMDILASPYVLTVASLIPLGVSMGLVEQYFPKWKRAYKWFALVGFLAIAVFSIAQIDLGRKISVPLFHSVAGLVICLGPFLATGAPKGFRWVSMGGLLIGLGGIALAFLANGSQLLFFSAEFVQLILTLLLLLMILAFTWGFVKDIKRQKPA